MKKMKTRIKAVRDHFGLTQEEFGKRIGSARNTVANYEMGNRNPSNAIITSICREFKVREEWLRDGEGEMLMPNDDQLSVYLGSISGGEDEFIRDLIVSYMELDETSKEAIKKLARNMASKLNGRD